MTTLVYTDKRDAFKSALKTRRGTLTLNDIRLAVANARYAIKNRYVHSNGLLLTNAFRADLDTYGTGYLDAVPYRRLMLGRFLVEMRGVRLA